MSALGQKQTSDGRPLVSALPPKAYIAGRQLNVRFVPIPDNTRHYRTLFDHSSARRKRRGRCCSRSGYCRATLLFAARRPGRIRTPAGLSQRLIGDRGLRGCPGPSRPAKWGVREGPPRFLPLRLDRFQSRLACCRGNREEVFSYPPLCWPGAARQFSAPGQFDSNQSSD
jgi:hypothetical protein